MNVVEVCAAALSLRGSPPRRRPRRSIRDYSPPRLPSGKPDLQGLWSNAVVTPLERPADLADKAFLTEEEAREYTARRVETTNRDSRPDDAAADILLAYNDFWWDSGNSVVRTLRTSLIVDPPNGKIPELTEAAKQRVAATRPPSADGPETQGLSTRCIYYATAGPPMLPGSYNNHYQLVQTDDHVLIVNEMVHETRIIPLDGRAFPPDEIRQWRGSSRGHWDGDTLVVETRNRRADTPFRGSSENMRLTERFTRVAADVLLYEFTVDDPEAFTQPWTVQIPSQRVEDELMYEYACHEGNKSMSGSSAAPVQRNARPRRPRRAPRGSERNEESVVCSGARGRGAARGRAGPPLVRVGVRCEPAGLLEGHRDEGGVHQSALVDPHRGDHPTARRPRGKSRAGRRTRCSAKASTTTRCPSARRSPSTVTRRATARTE